MNQVCGILHVNGFTLKVPNAAGDRYTSTFFIRELGYVPVDPTEKHEPKSYLFDLRVKINYGQLPAQDKSTLRFQSQKLNGLSFWPGRGETDVMPYESLNEIVRKMYDACKRPDADTIAFKGGDQEKKLLKDLKIPFLDLHNYGCPSYDNLTQSGMKRPLDRDCGAHTELKGAKKMANCSLMVVAAYRDWYKLNCKSLSGVSCTSTSAQPTSDEPFTSSDSE